MPRGPRRYQGRGCGRGAGAAHGYDLVTVANELQLTEIPIDAAAIYRALRQLEQQGLVTSAWDTSRPGPARRNYKLTAAGRRRLADWIDVIERRADALRYFVKQARSAIGESSSDPKPSEE